VQKKEIHYNDSMANAGTKYLNAAMQWLVDEGKEKKGMEIDKQEWSLVSNRTNVPQQANGFDCGVFSVVNADFASDNLAFEYVFCSIVLPSFLVHDDVFVSLIHLLLPSCIL
jgi:sentrin-specific protease 1